MPVAPSAAGSRNCTLCSWTCQALEGVLLACPAAPRETEQQPPAFPPALSTLSPHGQHPAYIRCLAKLSRPSHAQSKFRRTFWVPEHGGGGPQSLACLISLNRGGVVELGFEGCVGVGCHRWEKVFQLGNAKSLRPGPGFVLMAMGSHRRG